MSDAEFNEGFTIHDTSGGYFVCAECAHTWSEPAWPDRCENCHAPSTLLSRFDELDAAEEFSQRLVEGQSDD